MEFYLWLACFVIAYMGASVLFMYLIKNVR